MILPPVTQKWVVLQGKWISFKRKALYTTTTKCYLSTTRQKVHRQWWFSWIGYLFFFSKTEKERLILNKTDKVPLLYRIMHLHIAFWIPSAWDGAKVAQRSSWWDTCTKSIINSFQKWLRILIWLIIPMNFQKLLPVSYLSPYAAKAINLLCCGSWQIGNRKQGLKIHWNYKSEKNSKPFLETVHWESIKDYFALMLSSEQLL